MRLFFRTCFCCTAPQRASTRVHPLVHWPCPHDVMVSVLQIATTAVRAYFSPKARGTCMSSFFFHLFCTCFRLSFLFSFFSHSLSLSPSEFFFLHHFIEKNQSERKGVISSAEGCGASRDPGLVATLESGADQVMVCHP